MKYKEIFSYTLTILPDKTKYIIWPVLSPISNNTVPALRQTTLVLKCTYPLYRLWSLENKWLFSIHSINLFLTIISCIFPPIATIKSFFFNSRQIVSSDNAIYP